MLRAAWMLMKLSLIPIVMSGAIVPGSRSSVLLEYYLAVVAFCLLLSAGYDFGDWERERHLRKGRWPSTIGYGRGRPPDFLPALQGVQTARKNFLSAEEELGLFLWEVAGIILDQIPSQVRKTTIEFVSTQLHYLGTNPEMAEAVVLSVREGVHAIVAAAEAALVPISITEADAIRSRLRWIREKCQQLEEAREQASLHLDLDRLEEIQDHIDALEKAKASLEMELARVPAPTTSPPAASPDMPGPSAR